MQNTWEEITDDTTLARTFIGRQVTAITTELPLGVEVPGGRSWESATVRLVWTLDDGTRVAMLYTPETYYSEDSVDPSRLAYYAMKP